MGRLKQYFNYNQRTHRPPNILIHHSFIRPKHHKNIPIPTIMRIRYNIKSGKVVGSVAILPTKIFKIESTILTEQNPLWHKIMI